MATDVAPGVLQRAVVGRRRWLSSLDALGFLTTAVVVVVIAYPLVRTVLALLGVGADGELGRLTSVLGQRHTWVMTLNTVVLVAVGGGIALVIGAVFAWLNERTDARMGFVARILPLVPMFVPSIASAIGWVFLASPGAGLLNTAIQQAGDWFGLDLGTGHLNIFTWPGLIFEYVLYLTPYAYITISSGLQSLDPALEEASQSAGAGPFMTFRRVTLPSIRPALGASLLILSTMGVALFSIPLVIGTPARIDVLTVQIVRLMSQQFPPDPGSALGLSLIVVVIIGLCWLVQRRIVSLAAHATITGRARAEAALSLGRWKWPCRIAMIGFLMLTSVLPLAALVLVSFEGFWSATIPWNRLGLRNYRSLFETPEVWSGLRNSVGLAVLCASITLLVGILVVLTVRRSPRVPGSVVDAIAKLPATLTHIVIALAFIIAFAGPPFRLGGTYVILGMAYVVLYLPQATFYATAALDQIGKQLSEASYVSGASGSMTLRRVLLPLMAPSLMAAWSLIFVLMTGDITASSMLASTHTPVVGFMIMDIWGAGSFPLLAALGVLMTIVASAVVVVVMRFRDRIVIVR